jgi:hypothetical protein
MSLRSAAHAFSWAEVCAQRLERNGLASPSEHGRPADIVRAMCGAHAQVFAAAALSVGIRSLGISQAEVRGALWEERSLVKTYGPRGTVHLLPAEDLSLWTGALGAIPPPAAIRDRFLTPGQTDEVIVAIAGSLRTDELTAAELGDAVVARTGPWAGELVMPAFSGGGCLGSRKPGCGGDARTAWNPARRYCSSGNCRSWPAARYTGDGSKPMKDIRPTTFCGQHPPTISGCFRSRCP